MADNAFVRLESTSDSPEDVQNALGLVGDASPNGTDEQATQAPSADQERAPASPPDTEPPQDAGTPGELPALDAAAAQSEGRVWRYR